MQENQNEINPNRDNYDRNDNSQDWKEISEEQREKQNGEQCEEQNNRSDFADGKEENAAENEGCGKETAENENSGEEIQAFSFEWQGKNEEQASEDAEQSNALDGELSKLREAYFLCKSRDENRGRALMLSAILSATSMLFLVVFCFLLSFGVIPAGGQRVIYVPVSTDGATIPSGDEVPAQSLDSAMEAVVSIGTVTDSGTGAGTGIVFSSDGYIVTNYHVIEGATQIDVFLKNNNSFSGAEVIGYSEADDLAVIKVDADKLKTASFGKSSALRTGETIYAIGTPKGIEFGWSVSKGIISHTNREIKIYGDDGLLEKKMYLLQTDTTLNPGNSGGPIINTRGEVVGIATLRLSNSVGMGFAIPIDGALEIIAAIIEHGNADNVNSSITVGRPMMGIVCVSVSKDTFYEYTDDGIRYVDEAYANENPDTTFFAEADGVYVSSLTDGLDAKNHLQVGDIIDEINGVTVRDTLQIGALLERLNGGDIIRVRYYRNGQYFEADIILGTVK